MRFYWAVLAVAWSGIFGWAVVDYWWETRKYRKQMEEHREWVKQFHGDRRKRFGLSD